MQKVDEEIYGIVSDFRSWHEWWRDCKGDCPTSPTDILRKAKDLRFYRDDRLARRVSFAIEYFFEWLRPDVDEKRAAFSRVASGEFEEDKIMRACVDYLLGLQLGG